MIPPTSTVDGASLRPECEGCPEVVRLRTALAAVADIAVDTLTWPDEQPSDDALT